MQLQIQRSPTQIRFSFHPLVPISLKLELDYEEEIKKFGQTKILQVYQKSLDTAFGINNVVLFGVRSGSTIAECGTSNIPGVLNYFKRNGFQLFLENKKKKRRKVTVLQITVPQIQTKLIEGKEMVYINKVEDIDPFLQIQAETLLQMRKIGISKLLNATDENTINQVIEAQNKDMEHKQLSPEERQLLEIVKVSLEYPRKRQFLDEYKSFWEKKRNRIWPCN